MAGINWAFLCDYASIDASGKGSIIGIFSEMRFPKLPSKHPQIFVPVELSINPNEQISLGTQISAPSGNIISKIESQMIAPQVNLSQPAKQLKCILIFSFYGVEFKETGEYHIELIANNQTIHFLPLQVFLFTPKH